MAFTRKHLGSGQISSAATETTLYQPATAGTTGVIGSCTFYNAHATDRIEVTVYAPHSGAAASTDIIEKFSLDPGKSHNCTIAVNKVVAGTNLFSAQCDTATACNYSLDGGEE